MFTPSKLIKYKINLEFIDMKKFVLLIAVLALLTSCGSGDRGELVGVKGKKWHPEKPYGMTLIPGGAFIMGKSDDDLAGLKNAPTRTVTVRAFYMDETEITNSEYRQFVNWVRDSIIRTKLAILADEVGENESKEEEKIIYESAIVTKSVVSDSEPSLNSASVEVDPETTPEEFDDIVIEQIAAAAAVAENKNNFLPSAPWIIGLILFIAIGVLGVAAARSASRDEYTIIEED